MQAGLTLQGNASGNSSNKKEEDNDVEEDGNIGIQSAFLRLIAHLTPLLIAEVGASHVVCVPTSPFPPHALLIAEMGRRTWYAGRLDSPR